ncbi:MAG: Glutamine--scyllo-inositol transaminase [Solirubrobacterales bacterium]|jgi:perosamine synthetase|nr:Glutamine--scyllo-inositol transaminase [Solirubrobacterales bacterium]
MTPPNVGIPLARPQLSEREQELVLEVMRSGRLSLGPMLERFERGFAERLGVAEAVAVSSGTAALHLGVRALGWSRGQEVVTSPFSFVASANCLLYEDVTPVFCDVDPVTLNIDPGAAWEVIGERTAGLLPVDILGYPAALPSLAKIAAEGDLGLLEDACEALGARDAEGVEVGSRGHLASFAFYANKQLTTGEGGMLTTADADLATRLRSERNQGRAPDMSWVEHDRLGFNYRLTEIQAAIGVAQLERLDEMLAARARVAGLYGERLAALDYGAPAGEGDPAGLVLPCPDRGEERRSWFVYAVRLPAGADRDAVVADLAQRGVEAKAYMPSIHLMSHMRERFGFRQGQFPIAEDASARLLALPFFPAIAEQQIDRVCEALAEALRGNWT